MLQIFRILDRKLVPAIQDFLHSQNTRCKGRCGLEEEWGIIVWGMYIMVGRTYPSTRGIKFRGQVISETGPFIFTRSRNWKPAVPTFSFWGQSGSLPGYITKDVTTNHIFSRCHPIIHGVKKLRAVIGHIESKSW